MTGLSVLDAATLFATPVPIAVLRTASAEQAVDMGEALAAGGLMHLEVTLTTPGACEAIAELAGAAGARGGRRDRDRGRGGRRGRRRGCPVRRHPGPGRRRRERRPERRGCR